MLMQFEVILSRQRLITKENSEAVTSLYTIEKEQKVRVTSQVI